MIELKRCPFCGGKAILDREDIFCDECNLSMKIYDRLYNGEAETYEQAREQAIEAWNTRKPMERIVERLEEFNEGTFIRANGRANGKTLSYGYSKGIEKAVMIVKEEGEMNE